ncbi:hypothetical protein KU6B_22100 [Mameliella alba]|uniref:NAD(P)/FAD-dependent oxidoreductase n=1 Tax=Mameliella alba TaxID=561184 RepID=UPI0013E46A1B|nr:FAD-binding oxidoreductase [Mameliella alba]BBU55945.1 hypothetical protein KU6B_22100 [Mameliella alba]
MPCLGEGADQRAWGLDNRVIDWAEIDRIAPYLSDRVIAAALCRWRARPTPTPLAPRSPARLIRDAVGDPDFSVKPELLPASLAGNADMAIRVLPELARVPAIRGWVGTTPVTEDQLPLVGPVPDMPGAFVATGGSAFTLGPSFAEALAALVSGRTPETDLSNFDPARYRRT